MEPMQLAIALVILLAGVVAIVAMYKRYNGEPITIDDFIRGNLDFIVKFLREATSSVEERLSKYDTMGELYADIIDEALERLKNYLQSAGVNTRLMDRFDKETLKSRICELLVDYKFDIFSCLDGRAISANSALFDDEVVARFSAPIKSKPVTDEVNDTPG